MSIFGKFFKKSKSQKNANSDNIQYVEGDMSPEVMNGTLQSRCCDDDCPCPSPGTIIPRGTGYIYISEEVVEFRRKYPVLNDAKEAMQHILYEKNKSIISQFGGGATIIMPEFGGVLVCKQGARLRNLDLDVAATDAKHWWKHNQIPLRPTPKK